jgi:hypothetical protein
MRMEIHHSDFLCYVIMITSIVAALTPVTANPNQIFAADGSFGFKDLFGEDEIAYASGDIDPTPDDGVIPVADIYVVADEPSWGETLVDVNGTPNTITSWMIGGQFFDEIVWLPPLQRGIFYLVIDENQNGIFDSVYGVSDAVSSPFQVGEPVGAKINVTAIKSKAGVQHEQWNATANHLHWVSDTTSAICIGWSIILGNWIYTAVLIFGVVTGLPTDYNRAVMNAGGKVIEGIASVQAAHFKSLHADPPDPNYNEFATIDMDAINSEISTELAPLGISATYPFAPLGSTSYEASQIDLVNKMAMLSALISALQSSIEKYQGADNASDDYYTYLQAQAVKEFSDMLVINLNDTKQALENYKAEQISYGLGDQIYSVAEITALRDRLATTGLTSDEIEDLKNSGFSDAEITAMIDRVINLEVPAEDFTRAGIIDDITTGIDDSLPAFQNLSNQAQAVMDDIGPYVERHHPVAVLGGPYTGEEGSPITFNGSDSYDLDGDALTYEWDFDLDGNFDDASGAIVTWTWKSEFSGIIGLNANDTTGLSDIAYTTVTVSSINEPPIIDSFSPAELEPTASQTSPLDFSVTAHDPDGDPLSYSWSLDGIEVSTDTSWTYTPGASESGLKVVRVTISDENPLSRDTIERRVVKVIEVQPRLCGDANGDGNVDFLGDVIGVARHYMYGDPINCAWCADVDCDDDIDFLGDAIKIARHYMYGEALDCCE